MKCIAFLFALGATTSAIAADSKPLNFNRDIRPILSAKCFSCHGPDGQDRDADYRLDTKEGAFADLGGYAAIVPGKPDESELVFRITTDDSSDLMPPPKHKNPLTKEEIELLTRWIEEGAPFSGHWAFEPVKSPDPPGPPSVGENPIDRFVGARLAEEGLSFSRDADPETLVRRLHLDLTGLPPSIEEIDRFIKNPEVEFEATIDRLMDSAHFAERLALEWLDVARFADTNGYSIDDHRDMWAWRDWVIDAFQGNLPYDQFIRQQIAGDLMPDPSQKQIVATGFLRNAMNTHEGGTIPAEYKVARIADQIDTVSTAFMGLTMKCAQCHDHKYDPISMRDYYSFYAFFNKSSEPGMGAKNGNTKPFIHVDPILQDREGFQAVIRERIAALEYLKAHPESILGNSRKQWEKSVLSSAPKSGGVKSHFPFPTDKKGSMPSWIWSNAEGSGEFAWFRKTFSLDAVPEGAQLFVSCDNEAEIWINGKHLGKNPDWREPSVFDLRPLLVKGENLIAVAAKDWEKGGSKAALLALAAFSDGGYIGTDASWLVTTGKQRGWNQAGAPEGFSVAAVVAPHGAAPWGDTFSKWKGGSGSSRAELVDVLHKPDRERSPDEQVLVTASFAKANKEMDTLVKSLNGEIGVLRKSLETGKTSVMVMDEAAADRKTPMLNRGAYDQPGELVEAAIPSVFGELSDSAKPDRLALANWLTDPSHPLTARVTVNRYWQMLFGTGIVKTAEDFGSQGEWPSHPEMLDWLASEFINSGWDVRALLRTMLTSQTYRQESRVTESLLEKDPYNRLLSRAPRFRLPAESVRDSALSIGGLLKPEVGGPSVYPPQPSGLWKEVSHYGYPGFFSAQHFFPDRNRQIFRRSLYTFWKRTSPPPVMQTFDAPNRETCSVRRSLTNTPLQALVLMNAPQFVEASQGLALRILERGGDLEDGIIFGFRLATARHPSVEEVDILKSAYQRQLDYFKASPDYAAAFIASSGEVDDGTDLTALAAMSSVASLILNLDETITRE